MRTVDRNEFLRLSATFGVLASAGGLVLDPLAAFAAGNPNQTPAKVVKKSKYLIGFSQSELNGTWRTAESESMEAEAKKRTDKFDYRATVANSDTNKQISDVSDLIAAKCDLIVITPREEDPLRAATQKCLAAGIPVIEIDRTSTGKPGQDYVCAIESNFVQQGQKVGTWMVDNTRGPINYVELRGTTGASPAILRHNGFHDIIDKQSRFKLLDSQDGDFTLAGGKKVMTNYITRFGPKIDMIYAHNDDMGVGAYQAMKEAGFSKKVYIGSIDGTRRAIQYVADGVFSVVVQSDPHFGPITFDTIEKYFAGQPIPPNVPVSDHTYTKTNAAALVSTGF